MEPGRLRNLSWVQGGTAMGFVRAVEVIEHGRAMDLELCGEALLLPPFPEAATAIPDGSQPSLWIMSGPVARPTGTVTRR